MINTIINGDALEVLKTLESESVNCCITSPPYYRLRDYGTATWKGGDCECDHKAAKLPSRYDYSLASSPIQDGTRTGTDAPKTKDVCPSCGAVKIDSQIGLEKTPEEYIAKLVAVFREVRRVIKNDGTLWCNIGDSYYNYRPGGTSQVKQTLANNNGAVVSETSKRNSRFDGIKEKDLIGIPWLLAFALRADGWYLRQDIIWHKPNPMPESVKDRCTKSHEYVFLLSKSQKYYYDADAIAEDAKTEPHAPGWATSMSDRNDRQVENESNAREWGTNGKSNKRSVWTVNTMPCKEAHFAVFPEKLIEPMIRAGCPVGGVVLDPFIGSGTTGRVARRLQRNFIGIDLNSKYCAEIASKRLSNVQQEMFV